MHTTNTRKYRHTPTDCYTDGTRLQCHGMRARRGLNGRGDDVRGMKGVGRAQESPIFHVLRDTWPRLRIKYTAHVISLRCANLTKNSLASVETHKSLWDKGERVEWNYNSRIVAIVKWGKYIS